MTIIQADPGCAAVVVVDDGGAEVDALLHAVAEQRRQAGWQVRGVLMRYRQAQPAGPSTMLMVDLHTQDEYQVSQCLGSGSMSCRADPQGFARASQVLRRAADEGADLVIVNRFGGLEAGGGGFRAELLAVLARGVPVLTAVVPRYLEAWRSFSGSATELPADRATVDAWLDGWASASTPRP